jgi:mono/diheme cytochrome c family protein
MLARIILSAAILLASHPASASCPPQANAACVVQRVVKQQVVQYTAPQQVYAVQPHAQAVVNYGHQYVNQAVLLKQVYPQQYYTVGAQIEEEAIAERVALKALRRLEAQLDHAVDRNDRREDRGFNEPPGLSVAQRKCASCHSPGSQKVADGKAPPLFSGVGEWIGTPEQAVAAVAAAKEGRMPPAGPELNDDDYFALKAYLTEASSLIDK